MRLETKVGAFFLATIAVLAVLIFRTEKLEIFGSKNLVEYATEFSQVAGLSLQSNVRIAGVKVGVVKDIKLLKGRARITFTVPPDVPVYGDASAKLSSIGILGEKYIDLDPGHPDAGPFLAKNSIPTSEGVSLDNLMESLAGIGKDVKNITSALSQSIGGEEGRQKLDEIVDNIRVLTGEFRAMSQENHAAINSTVSNVQAITSDLRDRLPRMAQQFESLGKGLNAMVDESRPELKGLMTDVRKLAQSFQATSENIRSITDKVNKGEGTIGKLLNDEATVKKINAAVDNVNDMLGGLKNMELHLDMNASQWTRRGDSRVGLGLEILPRQDADYWYSLGVASSPDGRIEDKTVTVTNIDPITGLPVNVLQKTRTVTSDQTMVLSAEFAKRLGKHVVIHAGLVDSRGGAGIEYRAMQDRFRLGALAYDFSKRDDKPNPRYRVTGSYQFWKGLYGQVGVQDIANPDLRTFFVGGGIRWKDDDLKKLVGLAAGSVGK